MEEFSIPADREPEYIGEVGFEPAFTVRLEYEAPFIEQTPHGERIVRKIVGGSISGRIDGTVYPRGAGEYSLRRADGVIDLNAHILVQDRKGEWVYIRNAGYQRPDRYYRVTSWVDADVRGHHDWVLGLFFIGKGETDADGKGATIDYYEVT